MISRISTAHDIGLTTDRDGALQSSIVISSTVLSNDDPVPHKEITSRTHRRHKFNSITLIGGESATGSLEVLSVAKKSASSVYEGLAGQIPDAVKVALNGKEISKDAFKFALVESAQKDGVDLSHAPGFENIEKAMQSSKIFAKAVGIAFENPEHSINESDASHLAKIANHKVVSAADETELNKFINFTKSKQNGGRQ